MNYGELKTAIADYLKRSDLTTEIPDFITRAEQRMGKMLRIVENRVTSTETPSSGEITLPTRFVEAIRLSTGSGASLVTLVPMVASFEPFLPISGKARYYYITDKIYLVPAGDADVDIHYYEYPEPMTSDSHTRPILDRYEMIYIAGAMAQATQFTQDWEAHAVWDDLFQREVTSANTAAGQAYTPVSRSPYNYTGGSPRGV